MTVGTVFQNTLLLTLMMLAGYILTKLGTITAEGNSFLTRLLLDFIIPCAVISASCNDISSSTPLMTVSIIGLFMGLLVAFTYIGMFISKRIPQPEDDALVMSRCIAYPNTGFMGMPLCTAVFGAQGTIWCAMFILVTNLYLFFFLQHSFRRDGGGDLKSQLMGFVTPLNIASMAMLIIMLGNLKLPAMVTSYIGSFGNCMTPLAMLIVGSLLAKGSIADAFKDWRIYFITFMRNIVSPLVAALVLLLLGWERDLSLCIILVMGSSIASTVSIMGERYNRAPVFAGQALLQSTVLLPITLPLVMLVADFII